MAQACMSAAHKVERFRIRGPVLQKAFKRIPCVFVLVGCIVCRSDLTPYFVLAVRRIAGNDLLKILNGVGESFLRPRYSPELVMRIDLVVIDLNCTFEAFTCCIKFASLLMDQAKVVMR